MKIPSASLFISLFIVVCLGCGEDTTSTESLLDATITTNTPSVSTDASEASTPIADATIPPAEDASISAHDASINDRPERFLGCRAPTQEGCESCCEIGALSGCTYRSTSAPGVSFYNVNSSHCPSLDTCAICAICLQREEDVYLAAIEHRNRLNCDCDNITLPVDPCFSPGSCECQCARIQRFDASCSRN